MATQVERREQTRQALLDAAEEAFTSRGFHGVSLDAIAEAAGYSKGAVYGRFGGKDALFLAVVERRFERRLARLEDAWRSAASVTDALVAMLREQSRQLRDDTGWPAAWLEFVVHATRQPQTMAALRELDGRLVRGAATALAAGSGLSARDGDYVTVVSLVVGSGLMVERLLSPSAPSDQQVERLARALARDLEPGATT
jgi:AcrR family transcriptional regulator